ncbi:protein takeout-like [Adelges cooleyi]|uniref:protein takeout-like n=1 Tax=Adelges cooleyi TaxID=133065 RepID=UPI00217F2EB2|nr:protein takeout-like [Adelges cooleyi]
MFTVIAKYFCCLFLVFACTAEAGPASKLPKGFIRCSLSDPDLNKCIWNGLNVAFPYMSKGIPSLGLFPVDPLHVTKLVIDEGSQGPVQIKMQFEELDIYNFNSTIIKDYQFDTANLNMSISVQTKLPIVLEGLYEMNGKVLVLPITGKGKCRMVIDNYSSKSYLQFKKIIKNGVTYLELVKLSWNFSTTKLHLKFENLFNGDKSLGDNMNVFLNENWRELLADLQPAFEEALGAAVSNVVQQFFSRVPLNQIFSE